MHKHLRVCLAQDMISHFPKSRPKGHISSIQQVRMLRYTLFKNDTDKHDKPCPNMHVDIKQDKKNNRSVECSTTLFKNDTDKHDKPCPNICFIECFTTTFLRAHSWLNWVPIYACRHKTGQEK